MKDYAVDENENLKKELFEIKKKNEAREKKLIEEILRKEGITKRLNKEKNFANKKLKEKEENFVDNIKKGICLLKKEKNDLSL